MSDVAVRAGRATRVWLGAAMGARPVPARPFAVAAYARAEPIRAEWHELAALGAATPYQISAWIEPWLETIGAAAGVKPMFVVARADDGRVMAILPFGLVRQGGLTVASFLGGRDSNYNMGLFRPGHAWTRDALESLLRRAAAASGHTVDLYTLTNQPHAWNDALNPFLLLPSQASPSFAYKTALGPSEAFFKARLSPDARKKLRQKASRLKLMGEVEMGRVETPHDIADTLDALIAQRISRSVALGLPTHDFVSLRAFLGRAAGGGGGPVEVYAARCGGRIIATLAGVRHAGRFCSMLISFAAEPEFMRVSPGDLLLTEVIRSQCEAGTAVFDLGIGEARYKESYCPEVEPLFDTLVAVTQRGRLFARAEQWRLQAKRRIKQSPWAWASVQRLRRTGAAIRRPLA